MLQLNPAQYEALYHLVEGNDVPVDKRTLSALKRRGLVNSFGQPTTNGWHTVGRFRYIPEMPRLRPFEIQSWEGYVVAISEEPDYAFDEEGEPVWHRADHVTYYLNFQRLVHWYAIMLKRKAEYVENHWDVSQDRDVAAWGPNAHHMLNLKRAAKDDALHGDERYYTNHIFYDLVSTVLGHRTPTATGSSTSFKYSLQDNEDEFKSWLVEEQPARLTWTVTVD